MKISRKWRKLFTHLPGGYDPIKTADEGQYFNEEVAELAVGFFERCLRHVKGAKANQYFILENWQKALIGCLFGWKRADGTRRYRECLLYIPRKNGKTALGAGIALLCLMLDNEEGAEIYSAAASREQATLIFQHARGFVEKSKALSGQLKVFKGIGQRAIEYDDLNAFYKVLPADADTQHGLSAHLALIDELHAQKGRELVDVLRTSQGARSNPLTIYLTTADYMRPSVCNETYEHACKVRDGIVPDSKFLPVIYEATMPKAENGEAPPDDWWYDEALWREANPNLGVSINYDWFKGEADNAKNRPSILNTFLRLHLNIRTETDVRWLNMEAWDQCAGAISLEDVKGEPCYIGVDLSSTEDLTAAVMVFHERDPIGVIPIFWLPSETMHERSTRSRVPYSEWVRSGHIRETEGNVVDFDVVRRDLVQIGKHVDVQGIAIDRWNSTQITTQLAGEGFDIVQFGQGFVSMNEPTKELERLVMSRRIDHGGHPVLRWMASNTVVKIDEAGNMKPNKKRSAEKIDGIVGLIMGIGLSLSGDDDGGSVYDSRGVITL